MEQLTFDRVGERMYREKLENGLTVCVFPKPEFQKGYSQKEFSALALDCEEILDLSKKQDGFAINPYGFNLVFHRKNLQRLYRYRAEHPETSK